MTERAALTIDYELFTHTPAYRSAAGTTDRKGVGIEGGRFLQRALRRNDATATWFVVGEVAEEHPAALEAIVDDGHEIASHTHTHRLLTDLDAGERRGELRRSREVLESTTGERVTGFRAPAFDFGPDHFRTLAELGYEYDSSVVPSRKIPGWYGGEYDVTRAVPATDVDPDAPAGLTEVPASVMPGIGLPLTGAWLRFFGPRYTVLGMKMLARRDVPPVLYVHPWEFVDLPTVEGVPYRVPFRTGEWMRRAVERILAVPFEYVSVREIVEDAGLGEAVDGADPTSPAGRGSPADSAGPADDAREES